MPGKLFTLVEEDESIRGHVNTEVDPPNGSGFYTSSEEEEKQIMRKNYGKAICVEPGCQKEFNKTGPRQIRCPSCALKHVPAKSV
jgi:DNA-directed RNA polymerase subunit RPC12/RpoP